MKKLSILICTVPKRAKELERLLKVLEVQMTPEVEVLTFCDDHKATIGEKRNELVKDSIGEYIVFIDDDDLVPYNYIKNILNCIKKKPDVIGMWGIITFDGENPKRFLKSFQNKSWYEKDNIYYRSPTHTNPVKRSLAIQVPFPSKCYGEDFVYSNGLLKLIKTEIMIEENMYYYLFSPKNSESSKRKNE